MLDGRKIGVVVPAYNEEKLIGRVIETMPDFVDKIIVIDDLSKDKTIDVIEGYQAKIGPRLTLLKHTKNMGVGGAVLSGYKRALEDNLDVIAVMQGDAQTDPDELIDMVTPILNEEADYTKGNRLFTGDAWNIIPRHRYLGNAFLSLSTKVSSGYWQVADSQSGFTAISNNALTILQKGFGNLYKRYGFFNDLLIHLNVFNFRVQDVYITPIYDIGEKSGIKLRKVIPSLTLLLSRRFLWRMKEKYIIRDFHPLVFFYVMGSMLFWLGIIIGTVKSYDRVFYGIRMPAATVVLVALLIITGLQSLFFAMWFDMEYSRQATSNSSRLASLSRHRSETISEKEETTQQSSFHK